jgi:uncharacterized lipoprotein
MRKPTVVGAAIVSVLLAGCSGQHGLGCGDDGRYANSRSAPPLRVPDDLSVPDESDSLSVPPARREKTPATDGRCLATPPPFSDRAPSSTADSSTVPSGNDKVSARGGTDHRVHSRREKL